MAFSIATFNVKNLLEPTSDAARAVLPEKLASLARMLTECDADVVGLQEIGSDALLAQVLERMATRGGYRDTILGTRDARGIGCAALSRLPVFASRVHTCDALPFPVYRQGDPPPFGARLPLRRGVVQVSVQSEGIGAVDVFVAHFKSPRPVRARDAAGVEIRPASAHERAEGELRSLAWRAAEALFVRACVDEVLLARPDACVAAVGDFNDEPASWAVRTLRSDGDGALFDATTSVPPEARYTCLHDGRRIQIDHVLATAQLHARIRSSDIRNGELREHEPLSEQGEEVPTADSDHAPVVVRFG